MGKFIKGINRNQIQLLPPSVDDYIDGNNEVRVVDAFIDSLDLFKLGFKNVIPNHVGSPSYDPSDLLKIFVYCYPKKIRSSRKIATELKRNLELIWLVGGITPDFRTISDFRKNNIEAIKNVLKEFNKLCLELNVFSRELSSLDGTKFKAVNSKDNNFTKDKLVDRIKRLNQKVDDYMAILASNDEEAVLSSFEKEEIDEKIKKARAKAIEYNNYLNTIADSGENQLSLTDKEARLMKCNNNMLVGFNTQMTVDTKSHIITSLSVSNKPNDDGCMYEMALKVKEAFEVDSVEQLADGGYVNNDDLKKCLENKIVPILPDDEYEIVWDYKEHDIDDEIKNGNSIEDIKKCFESGVIPDCYSSLDMKIEVIESNITVNLNALVNDTDEDTLIEKAKEGFFVRNKEKNVVYCPSGNVLKYKRKKGHDDIFVGNSNCINCKRKCTKNIVRELELDGNVDIAPCKIYGTGLKKNKTILSTRKVVLKYRPDKNKYKLRKNTSEHPFGTLKRAHDATYLLLKGQDKVEGELTLSVLGYNINRLIKIVGVENLIEYLNNKNNKNSSTIFTNNRKKSILLFFFKVKSTRRAFF